MNLIELTRRQCVMVIASFTAGVLIACICLFAVPPPGEISNSAISIVSAGTCRCHPGGKTSYDIKFRKFEAELQNKADKEIDKL